jgi:hypothetical protein
MSAESRIAACLLSLALGPVALAQTSATSTTESTAVAQQTKSGEVVAAYGNNVVLKEADGLHEYTVPDGFKFDVNGSPTSPDMLEPGMKVNAAITDKITTRQVRLTRIESGTVKQVAPGGFVLQDDKTKELRSYNFKDPAGNDIHYLRDGKEVPLRNVKMGDRLAGTFVTTLPPQQVTQRSVVAKATEPTPPPAPAPVAVASATPHRLPKTASPLPLIGLLAALFTGTALSLRAARR